MLKLNGKCIERSVKKDNFNIMINRGSCRNDNFEETATKDNDEEEAEENDDKGSVKSETKKTSKASNKPTKLANAVAKEKNNSSLLNFFQSQKRTLDSSSSSNRKIDANNSHFLMNRKLKFCALNF